MNPNIRAGRQPVDEPGGRIDVHGGGRLNKTEAQDVARIGILGEQLDLQIFVCFNLAVSGRKETGRRVARCARHHAQCVAFTVGGALAVRYLHRDVMGAQHTAPRRPADDTTVRVDGHAAGRGQQGENKNVSRIRVVGDHGVGIRLIHRRTLIADGIDLGRTVARCLLADANGIQHIDKRILITVRVSGSGGLLQYLGDDDRDVSSIHRSVTIGVTRQQGRANDHRTEQHDSEEERQADIEKFFPDKEEYSNHR